MKLIKVFATVLAFAVVGIISGCSGSSTKSPEVPGGLQSAQAASPDLDKEIAKNLAAALANRQLQDIVKYDVKNGVVTLTGEVNTKSQRENVEELVYKVPNVRQVVDQLSVFR